MLAHSQAICQVTIGSDGAKVHCNFQRDDTTLIGSWHSVSIELFPGRKCCGDSNEIQMSFVGSNKFEMWVKSSHRGGWCGDEKPNYGTRMRYGSYHVDSTFGNSFLHLRSNLMYQEGDSLVDDVHFTSTISMHYPIHAYAQDTLVLLYNFCCRVDTCTFTSGIVKLIRTDEDWNDRSVQDTVAASFFRASRVKQDNRANAAIYEDFGFGSVKIWQGDIRDSKPYTGREFIYNKERQLLKVRLYKNGIVLMDVPADHGH